MRTLLFAPLILLATGLPAHNAGPQNGLQRNTHNNSLLSFNDAAGGTIEPRVQRLSRF